MKKLLTILLGTAILLGSASPLLGRPSYNNMTLDIPVIGFQNENWEKAPDVAQWGDGDWSGVIGRAENVSLKEAIEIAESNPEITFFFHMKGARMVLGNFPNIRVFHQGDAVFFKGEPHWGEAKGYADGYMKKAN